MATHDLIESGDAGREPAPGASMFAVRVWKEELAGGSEYRGSVRDVRTDAFRSFRDWSDLVGFMVARIERSDDAGRPAEEVRDVSGE